MLWLQALTANPSPVRSWVSNRKVSNADCALRARKKVRVFSKSARTSRVAGSPKACGRAPRGRSESLPGAGPSGSGQLAFAIGEDLAETLSCCGYRRLPPVLPRCAFGRGTRLCKACVIRNTASARIDKRKRDLRRFVVRSGPLREIRDTEAECFSAGPGKGERKASTRAQ